MTLSKDKIRFITLRTLGNFFVLFAIYGMLVTFGPALYLEVKYRVNQARNVKYAVSYQLDEDLKHYKDGSEVPTPTPEGKSSFFGDIIGGNRIEYMTPVSSQYGIVIPKIGANAPILPNVDAGNPDAYLSALQLGVAHAMGTVFPGVDGNIFLFAHSTDAFWNVGRYNAIFYLIKELEVGDEVDIFYKGVRHVYRVVNKLVVDPSEVHYLTESTPYEQLTLQTCWPPGTTLKRMIVIARPEKDLPN